MHIATHKPSLIAKHDKAFLLGRTARRFFVVGICLASSACSTPPNAPPPPRIVGDDADVHGCRASAGFVWDATRQQCVRPWLPSSPKAE